MKFLFVFKLAALILLLPIFASAQEADVNGEGNALNQPSYGPLLYNDSLIQESEDARQAAAERGDLTSDLEPYNTEETYTLPSGEKITRMPPQNGLVAPALRDPYYPITANQDPNQTNTLTIEDELLPVYIPRSPSPLADLNDGENENQNTANTNLSDRVDLLDLATLSPKKLPRTSEMDLDDMFDVNGRALYRNPKISLNESKTDEKTDPLPVIYRAVMPNDQELRDAGWIKIDEVESIINSAPAPVAAAPTAPINQEPSFGVFEEDLARFDTAERPSRKIYAHLATFSSDNNARRGWSILQARYQELVYGMEPIYEMVSIRNRDLIRLFVKPVSQISIEADELCVLVKNRGDFCELVSF